MEDWERCVLYFTAGDLDSFCSSTVELLRISGSVRGRSIELVSTAIDEFSRFHIEMAFDSDCDPYLSIESREVIHSLFTQITQKLVSVDPIVCSLLLRPV